MGRPVWRTQNAADDAHASSASSDTAKRPIFGTARRASDRGQQMGPRRGSRARKAREEMTGAARTPPQPGYRKTPQRQPPQFAFRLPERDFSSGIHFRRRLGIPLAFPRRADRIISESRRHLRGRPRLEQLRILQGTVFERGRGLGAA